jgi:predicted AlkP superfamily pyrophosphatase or phosphodiesterase
VTVLTDPYAEGIAAGVACIFVSNQPSPVLPNYGGACVSGIVPALLGPRGTNALPSWFPAPAHGAKQVVLLVLDGLGWDQIGEHPEQTPTLSKMVGGPITTVVPSTTATALTSIATGMAPGEHGIVGYRMNMRGEVLNVLRWSTATGDARRRFPAKEIQPVPAFVGATVPVVTKGEFASTGFTDAHLSGGRLVGWRMPSTLVHNVIEEVRRGASFVYAYYDGVDKVAHEFGLHGAYRAEVAAADRIVADLLAGLPSDAVLLVTADHGQIDCGTSSITLSPDVLRLVDVQSGEGRFRWLNAKAGAARDLLAAAQAAHGHQGWVVSVEQTIDEGWFGPRVTPEAKRRLGDVALVAQGTATFDDPADSGPYVLISRHGSLTSAEMLVPLLASPGHR